MSDIIKVKPKLTFLSLFYDAILYLLLGIWFWGGISIDGHTYLRHGADLRRLAIIFGMLGYFLSLYLRERSIFLRQARSIFLMLKNPKVRWWIFLLGSSFSIYLSYLQALALRVTLYDVGIFHQVLWNISHGYGFASTISKAGNFLNDHFCPSLLLLVPFFKLSGESPLFLPILQPLLIWAGAAAWIYLAERVPQTFDSFRNTLAAATTLFILTFESLWKNIQWGFHENALAFLTWSWALALIFSENKRASQTSFNDSLFQMNSKKTWITLGLLLLAAFSKEILLPDISLMLLVWVYFKWNQSRNLCPHKNSCAQIITQSNQLDIQPKKPLFQIQHSSLIAIALSLLIVFIWFEKSPHPADKNYFDRYYSYLGHDLNHFFGTLIQAPHLVLKTIGASELIRYAWTVFSPWIFLPVLSLFNVNFGKFKLWMIAILPSLSSAALSSFPLLRRPQFHYVLELWPILASLTLIVLAQLKSIQLIWVWVLFSLLRWDHDPVAQWRETSTQAVQLAPLRTFLQSIPSEASIMAHDLTGPWVASRRWISRVPDLELLPNGCPDYIIWNGDIQTIMQTMFATQTDRLKCQWMKYNSTPAPWQWNGWQIFTSSAPMESSTSVENPSHQKLQKQYQENLSHD